MLRRKSSDVLVAREPTLYARFWGMAIVLCPFSLLAHHSGTVFYDYDNFGELQGEVVGVIWKNPHVRYSIRVTNEAGPSELWQLETNSVNSLDRLGIDKDIVAVGDQIKVYGALSRHDRKDMRVSNILLVDGNEVLLMPPLNSKRQWTSEPLKADGLSIDSTVSDRAKPVVSGIFRIWSRGDGRESGPGPLFNNESFPLTDAAIAARKRWDPVSDDPNLSCIPYGMPAAMAAPYPIEFDEEENGDILIRVEEFDRERIIHMNGGSHSENHEWSRLGYSTGDWDGTTLVVETSHIDWPLFDKSGIPQSRMVRVTEYFIVSEDESRLDYKVTVIDPEMFSEPVHLYKFWAWNPDGEIKRYDCTVGVPVVE